MGEISNIDDLLMGVGNSQQAATPEHKDKLQKQAEEKAQVEEMEDDEVEDKSEVSYSEDEEEEKKEESSEEESEDTDEDEENDDKSDEPEQNDDNLDEYGNQKERMPKGMKDRLDRKDRQHQQEVAERDRQISELRAQLVNQGASKEVQKAAADFKYDPNDEASWQQQLTDFVKHTVSNMQSEEQQKARQRQEQVVEREFAQKFQKGMERFGDFREVVGSQPIDDAMTLSLRGMADPAAFIYAASKRNPQELERIAKLADPYVRMVEMGKLEERMRRAKPVTKAPRPLGRTREDTTAKIIPKEKKDTSGDDLLAKADAKRLATVRNRHARNR